MLRSDAYTGPERRFLIEYRRGSDWTNRLEHLHNREALNLNRSAEILRAMHGRSADLVESDALFDGYWYLNERRDRHRERVAEECAPWFDNSAFVVDGQFAEVA